MNRGKEVEGRREGGRLEECEGGRGRVCTGGEGGGEVRGRDERELGRQRVKRESEGAGEWDRSA